MTFECRVCLSRANHAHYRVREMMFGVGGEFDYFCCADCGCLQIAQVPENLASFYPPHYYSFHLQPVPLNGLKSWLAAKRDFSAATKRGLFGRLLNKVKPAHAEILSLGGIPARKDMRILDVGCGRGKLLSILHRAGVGRLEGVDPYLTGDVEVAPGLWVRKQTLDQVVGKFDLIMLHHVFEHIEFGRDLLAAARQRLSANGKILLRIPTPESIAWEKYRENWMGIDAPRHLFLHTRKSLGILATQAGLGIERCWSDSAAMHFSVSELYERGLSYFDRNGCCQDLAKHFTRAQMTAFARLARQENETNRGAQIVVVLSPIQWKPEERISRNAINQ